MADEPQTEQQAEQADDKKEDSKKKSLPAVILPWLIVALTVAVFAAAGFGLGRMFGSSAKQQKAESSGEKAASQTEQLLTAKPADAESAWYFDLEPVVANLDEPSATRYVRATLTLEMRAEMEQRKGTAFLEQKKPLLTNWLTIYLSSLNLENIRGDRNLKRIQSQICDAFNDKLFPDSKPLIKRILFKEFAIQ